MGDPRPGGIPGWGMPGDGPSKPRQPQPRYGRAIGWAFVAWVGAVAAAYLISEGGLPQLSGWIGLAGFISGIWFGGTMARMTGRREWVVLTLLLSAIAFLMIGLGSCVYAMALYG